MSSIDLEKLCNKLVVSCSVQKYLYEMPWHIIEFNDLKIHRVDSTMHTRKKQVWKVNGIDSTWVYLPIIEGQDKSCYK